jgi:DNA-binding GntR family transcriptional regulator
MTSLPSPRPLIVRTQLKDEAVAYVRELILSGQVPQGDLLRLAPLAKQLGASVTPVREALLLLAQDGWVTQEPNVGFRVAAIRRRDVEDAYFVQAFVAGELAARAASRIDASTLERLEQLDAEIQERGDAEGMVESVNYELHNMIFTIADSPRLGWFIQTAGRFVPRRFWGMVDGWFEHNRTGHRAVIDALATGDAEAARQAMSSHIAAAGDLLLAHLDSVGFWTAEQSRDAALQALQA